MYDGQNGFIVTIKVTMEFFSPTLCKCIIYRPLPPGSTTNMSAAENSNRLF